ncbi:hypothetical protein D6833_09600 [Candidatus Parcubacteria bacterium]|nr:MAG: hypothetical protein D6833_09600 [Candidatus Parcubacteria bacterium]
MKFWNTCKRFYGDTRGSLMEMAIITPMMLLLSIGMLNLVLYGIAGIHANNAANYAARVGAVAQSNPEAVAANAAAAKLSVVGLGTYNVSVSSAGPRGSLVRVAITYSVPSYVGQLAEMVGASSASLQALENTTTVYFRKEGW